MTEKSLFQYKVRLPLPRFTHNRGKNPRLKKGGGREKVRFALPRFPRTKNILLLYMDTTDLLSTAGLTTTGVAILAILYKAWGFIKGRRLVSDCCGKRMSIGVSTETITPSHSTGVLVESHHEVAGESAHAPTEAEVLKAEIRSRKKSVVEASISHEQVVLSVSPATDIPALPLPSDKLERQTAQPS